jgi:hypothetical protein
MGFDEDLLKMIDDEAHKMMRTRTSMVVKICRDYFKLGAGDEEWNESANKA